MTTTKLYRHPGEDAVRPEKEKGTTPFEIAPRNDNGNSTVEHSRETERGLYLPLAWAQLGREVKPQKFRGKGKRQARAAAIQAKRNQCGIGLFDAVAYLAFGAWLATVVVWLLEVL